VEKGQGLLKKRTRRRFNRISSFSLTNHWNSNRISIGAQTRNNHNSQQHNEQCNQYNRQWLLNEDSGMIVIELLLAVLLLVFLLYTPAEFYIHQSQHQMAGKLVNKYLDRMTLEGRLSSADEAALTADFSNIGLTVTTIEGQRENLGNTRVLKRPEDPDASTLKLKITATPIVEPIWTGKLIGANSGAGSQIVVGGERLSERRNP